VDQISNIKMEMEASPQASVALTKPSKHLGRVASKSQIDGLKKALQKFALLRGDVMAPAILESYSKALAEEFSDADVMAVLDKRVRQKREQFEPKIPEMGEMLEWVREFVRDRRRAESESMAIRQMDEMREVWEREREEDVAAGIPRVATGASLAERLAEQKEILGLGATRAPAAKRPLLTGWTAAELRAAADAQDAGQDVELPTGEDGYAVAARMRQQYGFSREDQRAAADRVLANSGIRNPESPPESSDPTLTTTCEHCEPVEPLE
jgi:hypothetical protein